ncbi:glycosyltransferase [Streptacidiphilus sp. ASG 303]|uniref:glycosyltransferase n=1 Tax=Streptacidiphilus sp. ASG 303 TaxID=2896847 RepID=UPI001E306B83|nr:glycosyltransferase [Streptacidiphilus sp. ASG 303]MCD0484722.1 glycosyltransferase [Streptacidiphilus sp. ASG 303]
MNVLMLVTSDVAHDSRVVREAAALAEAGHTVHVQGRDVPEDWKPPDGLFTVGSSTGGQGLRPTRGVPHGVAAPARAGASGCRTGRLWRAGRWLLLPRHRRRVWSAWVRAVVLDLRGRRFDVVHAHDFTALPPAARFAREQGALLVYDAHEWWSGRQRHGCPAPLERLRERRLEADLTARADAVVTVSEGIARRLERWAAGPVMVVRNTFPTASTSTSASTDRDGDGDGDAAADGDGASRPPTPAGLVYAGRIGAGRDLRTVLAGAAGLLPVVLVGPSDGTYAAGLTATGPADAAGVELLPPCPVDEVDALLRRHGLAVVTLTDSCDNHRLALPNKLFHAVRAGVPVVAADLPELRAAVERHDLGELYRPGDAASFRAAVERATARYPQLLRSVASARPDLSWEEDARRLVGLYEELASKRRRSVARGTAVRGGAAPTGSVRLTQERPERPERPDRPGAAAAGEREDRVAGGGGTDRRRAAADGVPSP